MKRRDFLKQSAAAAAAGMTFPYFVPSRVLAAPGRKGANDKIIVGFVGTGGRARHLMVHEKLDDNGKIVAVADCFLPRIEEAAKVVPGSDQWKQYQNYREMFEKEKLDAVFVATTTHARALICAHAMQAGLDIYAEKPLTLTVAEGRILSNAAKKYKRVLQVGTQQRSIPVNAYASKLVREGAIGKVHTVIAYNFEPPQHWTPQPGQPVPDGLDWDEWCNQTELRPYHPDLYRKWGLWWDYDGGGQSWGVSGWGTHALDQVQCALGTDDTGPVEIWPDEPGPSGKITMKYASGTLLKLHGPKRHLEDLGAIFIGDKGKIDIQRGSYYPEPEELLKGAPEKIPANSPGECVPHLANFFECVRTRQRPAADVEIGHRSTTVCHLVNICRELGRKLQWDPVAERFVGDDEANAKLSRPRRAGYEFPKDLA
ncbi:MAG: Gfo/Idh/MocA family oxidoreductase [Phycisphaerae bacterium]|nr:Gfo/Idh/MocA family oxidoreductase [Phycisphaerae bacterium]